MAEAREKILVIDDDPDIIEFITYNLNKEGYITYAAKDGESGIEKAKIHNPDLILLDVMMPGIDGMEVCRTLREIPKFQDTIIAFLTARGEDYSQISGFDSGGDEYITKPIRPRLLVARLKALLGRRRKSDDQEGAESIGCLSIDPDKMLVSRDGRSIDLTKMEYNLLQLLTSKPGKVFTREHIYTALWGDDLHVGNRTIDVHIRKLREKIGDDCIKTLKGVGYRFNESAD